jgi:N-carbamoyl-L-amino-acid hydrolase
MTAAVTSGFQPRRAVAFLEELRALSAGDGADRLAWSDGWAAARALMLRELEGLPARSGQDRAGNLWVVLDGERPDALLVGSHLDAVPGGGWLDGALGVAAGVELLRAAAERAARLPLSLALVDWADEEGARFGQAMLGSGLATGALAPAALAGRRDAGGRAIEEVLAASGVELARAGGKHELLRDAIAYLELHIEQGPVLDDERLPVAAVDGTVAVRRLPLTVAGRAEHVGPAPLSRRRDALFAFALATVAVRTVAVAHGGRSAVTVAGCEPNLPTVIAGRVEASVDLRHDSDASLEAMAADLAAQLRRVEQESGCSLALGAPSFCAAAARFDERLVAHAAAAAYAVGGRRRAIGSGALHDATNLSRHVPTAMLFARSLDGRSHCPQEDSAVADLDAALRAFADLAERAVADHLERSCR